MVVYSVTYHGPARQYIVAEQQHGFEDSINRKNRYQFQRKNRTTYFEHHVNDFPKTLRQHSEKLI